MIKLTADSADGFIRELAEFGAGGVYRGSVFVREAMQEINIARFQIGAVYSAILVSGAERSMLEYPVVYGEDTNGKDAGSEAFRADFAKILAACDDLGIKLREGRIEIS